MTAAKPDSKIERANTKRALRKHRKTLARTDYPIIWQGIEILLEPPYSPKRLTAFFDERVAYETIRNWRYGRSKPPAWACHWVADRLQAQGERLMNAADAIKKAFGPGRGHDKGAKHLAKWRAERAIA